MSQSFSDLAVSVASGALGGMFTFFITKWVWEVRTEARSRLRLLEGLAVEASGSLRALTTVLGDIERSRAATDKLAHTCPKRCPTSEEIAPLFQGWVLYAPSYSLSELTDRLPRQEAREVINYLDRWARFVEYEKRYRESLDELLRALPTDPKLECSLRAIELAGRTKDNLAELHKLGVLVQEAASQVVRMPAAARRAS